MRASGRAPSPPQVNQCWVYMCGAYKVCAKACFAVPHGRLLLIIASLLPRSRSVGSIQSLKTGLIYY